ncbi:MAG TPA: hypothetical protein VLW85_00710 [Myxococcales bacterium]|nr:hypothetical protein [Myxococcales bacterium]
MRASAILLCCLALAACRTSSLGSCAHDTDCPDNGACGAQGVCIVAECPPCPSDAVCQHGACVTNDCTPACGATQTCQSGVCVGQACTPPCDSAHTCNATTLACDPVATADVALGGLPTFATRALHVTATAHAPGGVTAVRFDLSIGGTVAVSVAGAAGTSDPSFYAADLALLGLADGPATVTATATYASNTVTSTRGTVTIDQTLPAVTLQTDGTTTLLAAGQTAEVKALITDSGSGIDPSSVALKFDGHADVAGTPQGGGVFDFQVPIDDSLMPAGSSGTVAFSVAATDLAGNSAVVADAKAVLKIDRDAPGFTGVQIVTAPDFTDGNGRGFYKGGAGALGVQATIADGAGVDAASVCLRIAGESGACAHAGTAGAQPNRFTFSLPRPTAPMDGTVPLDFTLTANDSLYAGLTGSSQAEHAGASAVQHVFFDNQPPAISIAADTAPYARGGPAIVVTATISDPTGVVTPRLVSGANQIAPGSVTGSTYSFSLDPADAPAGVEGAYGFSVSAADGLGHSGSAQGSRVVDGAPPAVSVQIYKDAPDGGGVTYPATVANTGWTGNSFVYSDAVHVAGTITDVSGIDLAQVHVDGTDLDGGVTSGVPQPLGCAGGATSCSFDVQIALNAAQNGAFHTGTADAGFNGAAIPSGFLQVVLDTRDRAQGFGGTPLKNSGSSGTPARATRFLWQQSLTSGNVSGLAVHPSGDVIATSNAAADTVYDLAPDRPLIRWSYGAADSVGSIPAAPAVGAGDASSAPIYVASGNGNFFAVSPAGNALWSAQTAATAFAVSPAVATVATSGGGTIEELIEPDNDALSRRVWTASQSTSANPPSAASNNVDGSSAPLVLGGSAWFGTGSGIERHALQTDGAIGSGSTASGSNVGHQFWGLISDGTNAFAASDRGSTSTGSGNLLAIDGSLNLLRNISLTHQISSEPTIAIDGKLVASDSANPNTVSEYDPVNSATSTVLANPGGAGRVPLQGSDGHWYLPRATAFLIAYEGSQVSWIFDPPNNIVRAAAMDCAGRLFVASGPTVYAFVTDDDGLADTPWPNIRRDARNTGNTGAPKYGIRTASGCTQ